jgi:hypothetical protein
MNGTGDPGENGRAAGPILSLSDRRPGMAVE